MDESLQALGQEVDSFRLVFGHFLAQVDEADRGAFFFLEAEEFEDSVVLGVVEVDVDEEDLA